MRTIVVASLTVVFLPVSAPSAKGVERKIPDKAKVILENASAFELYSLEPEEEKTADKPPRLHGWKVLGKTTVKRAEGGAELLAALEKAIASRKARGAKCFDPRHAIHAAHEGKTVDVLICFECGWVYVYLDGEKEAAAQVTLDRSAAAPFDKILRDAGITLAKKRKE